jgi:hypothetical protein
MASSQLVLHRGGRLVEYDELAAVKAPPPEGRWYPLSHVRVLDAATSTLKEAGYEVKGRKLGLSKDNAQFFGTLDLATPLATGVSLAVGVRNSINRTFPIGLIGGSRTFVCDNLAFRSDLMMVKRKHTLHGERRFNADIAQAVMNLGTFKDAEAQRIGRLMELELAPEVADSLMLRALQKGVINTHQILKVVHEWHQPSFDEFGPRTGWSLFNAFTRVLADRSVSNPQEFSLQTMRLHSLFEPPRDTAAEPQTALAT